jgi:hypothetical protein
MKIFTTFEINLASGFGCSASVSPIAKGAERYVQPYDDQHSYINRQKTKDKMPTLRKIKRGASLHTRQRFCTTFNFTQPHPKPTHHPTNANFAEWN